MLVYLRLRFVVVVATVVTPLLGLPGHSAARPRAQPVAHSLEPAAASTLGPEPLKLPDSALEPIDWNALDGWAVDDHAAAFATFLTSCRRDQIDALLIQIQGSARVRLEDGTMLRITYDAHNGYSYVPVGRILIERHIIPREEMSLERIREWMHANPQSAEEVRRQNRSFVFFRIAGLSDDREAVGAQGIPLTPGRSIAVDNSMQVYGTPFFIEAGLPVINEKRTASFDRLMIAQDTGSAIVGPARADIYWGSGDQAGQLAGRLRHPGKFAMLVPRELDPVAAGRRMPLPPEKPRPATKASLRTASPKSLHPAHLWRSRAKAPTPGWWAVRGR